MKKIETLLVKYRGCDDSHPFNFFRQIILCKQLRHRHLAMHDAMMQAISHSIRSNKGDDQRKLGLGGTLEEFHALPQQLLVGISNAVFRLAEFHLA